MLSACRIRCLEPHLEILAARRKKTRHWLKFLTNMENHKLLISNAYEDLMDTRPTNMPSTRAAARGGPRTLYATTSAYHNNFFTKNCRRTKSQP